MSLPRNYTYLNFPSLVKNSTRAQGKEQFNTLTEEGCLILIFVQFLNVTSETISITRQMYGVPVRFIDTSNFVWILSNRIHEICHKAWKNLNNPLKRYMIKQFLLELNIEKREKSVDEAESSTGNKRKKSLRILNLTEIS